MTPAVASYAWRRRLAWGLGVLDLLALLTAVVLGVALGWSWDVALASFALTNGLMGLTFGGCGLVLARHRPGNAIGWLFLGGGTLQAIAAAMPPVGDALEAAGAGPEVQRLLVTVFVNSWPWAIGLGIPTALLLFPDGRPLSPRWAVACWAVVLTAPLFVLDAGWAPEPVTDDGTISYLTIPGYDHLAPLWQVAEWRTLAAYLLALAALALRYRRGDEVTRRRLLWLVLALIAALVVMVPWGLVAGTPVAVLLVIPLIPVAVTVSIVRHGLLDIRLVVSRALAWVLLSLGVLLAYAVLVAALNRLVSTQVSSSALASVVVVLAAAPALPWLQRLVARAMYGDRDDPARVASAVGAWMATPETDLDDVAAGVRESLRLPYVALERDGGVLAAAGTVPPRVVQVPLTHGGQRSGVLVVGLRPGERRLGARDRQVLDLLAPPLAATLRSMLVSAELQASRERIVAAREEERRRLRRELHDNLGPALTGIALTADAAANVMADPERAAELLTALRRDTRAALLDVRRVVDELRPPALDELGLVGSLRQRADQLSRRGDGAPVDVLLDVPADLPDLPAAVEVATYRIATEALTNIARHSAAASAVVTLRCGDRLDVTVTDDGPPSGPWVPGVGLQAMRERAAELGGAFAAGPSGAGGLVHASIPVSAPVGAT